MVHPLVGVSAAGVEMGWVGDGMIAGARSQAPRQMSARKFFHHGVGKEIPYLEARGSPGHGADWEGEHGWR